MAKLKNELDIPAVVRKLKSTTIKKEYEKIIFKLSNEQLKIIKTLSSNKSIKCCIFTNSIAFRIGKSSIKTIPGYGSGFKGGIPSGKTSNVVFLDNISSSNFAINKDKLVLLAAYFFLYNHPDRVITESDKTEAAETEQVNLTQGSLKALIKENGDVKLKIGNNVYQIDEFKQVSGRPKADATFNYKGKPVIFCSLKKGNKPGAFQQYGGIADLGIKDDNLSGYPDIKEFQNKIISIFEAFKLKKNKSGRYDFNDFKKGAYFGYLLKDVNTACKVIFGKDYGSTSFGLNNCNITIDGDIVFNRVSKGIYELDGTYHKSVNPFEFKPKKALKFSPTDIYSPVLFVSKSESQGLNNLGFSNVRFYIWPKNGPATAGIEKLNNILDVIKSKNASKILELKKELLK